MLAVCAIDQYVGSVWYCWSGGGVQTKFVLRTYTYHSVLVNYTKQLLVLNCSNRFASQEVTKFQLFRRSTVASEMFVAVGAKIWPFISDSVSNCILNN